MDPVVQGAIVAMVGAAVVAIINGIFLVMVARIQKQHDEDEDHETAPEPPKKPRTRRRSNPDA